MKKKFHSIRTKYTIIFVCTLVVIMLAVILFMNFGLSTYIESEKKASIIETANKIDSLAAADWDSDESYDMMRIATQNNFGITVYGLYDSGPTQIFSTNFNSETANRRFIDYINQEDVDVDEIIEKTDNYVIYKTYDVRMGADQIECMGHNDDTAYVITTSMTGITDSVKLANGFLLWISIVGILIASFAVFFITRRITRPIIKLSKQSNEMTNLNFDVRYDGNLNNELGVLGENFNKMSDNLEKTITDLQEANKKLEADIAEKEEINMRQMEFIGNVSHELKTPIALISGYAEGLKDGIASDPESADFYIDVITDEASKMDKLVKRLLNLDEIESGRLAPVIEDFDIVEIAKGIVANSNMLAEEKGVAVKLNMPDSLIVNSDSLMMEQVMVNYVQNAYNHVSEGGEIEVSIRPEGDKTTFAVRNTGKNIPEEDIDRIWDKFYKVDKAHTRSYGGSGIGLSIVKSISIALNGSCKATNTEDGVEFTFTF